MLYKGHLNYREAAKHEIGINYLNSAISDLSNRGERICIARETIELWGKYGTTVQAKQYSIPEYEKERVKNIIDKYRTSRGAEAISWNDFKDAPLVAYFA